MAAAISIAHAASEEPHRISASPATVAGAMADAATRARCQQEELTVAIRPDNTCLFGREPTDDSMKKPAARKASAKKVRGPRFTKRVAVKRARTAGTAPSTNLHSGGKLTFNHAMVYVKDVDRALHFYDDLLGFKLIEDFRYEGTPVYARMSAPGGDGTIALHQAGPGDSLSSDGVRLYFEVRDLDEFCQKLQQKGFFITKLPRMMPWGWRHAYLNDPDGHEISLYWAGENRMKKTMMRVAGQHAKAATQSR
jgi:catechol 2,3-dioxygenase-like lactoylglutathione lyase family enzyme